MGGEVVLLIPQQLIRQELVLYLGKADACNGVRKAFSGDALRTEEENGLFYDSQDLFLAGEDGVQRLAVLDLFAPATANVDAVAIDTLIKYMEGAGADAAAAVIAGRKVELWLCPLKMLFITMESKG